MNENYTKGGCRIVHRERWDEESTLEYFKRNIQIKKNGVDYDPQQLIEHRQIFKTQPPSSSEDVKPIDPNEFFGSSMRGLL